MADWRESLEAADDSEGAAALVRRPRRRAARIASLALLALGILLLVAVSGAWLARKPIANDILAREMDKRGVTATYHLDRIGLRTQRISNLIVGDPKRPDLTARFAQVQMRIRWNGSVSVYRIVARGVRLNGRLIGKRVSWGQVDRLLPPPSGKPFSLPNVAVDIADSSIALATEAGPLGIAVEGVGNLASGFKGRLAAFSPRLVPGKCELVAMRASVAVAIVNRRPNVAGPLSADRFACRQSRIALEQPRFDVTSSFSEAFASFGGGGRLAIASLVAGENGLANVGGRLSFAGTPTEIHGAIDLSAQRARLARILADRTRLDGRYYLGAASGKIALVADYDASSIALDPVLTQGVTGLLAALGGSPIGPIATSIADAVTRTGRAFDATGTLRLINAPGGGAVRIQTADARSAAGARIRVSGGDGVTYYWPSGRLRVDGLIETAGGGLPTGRIALDQPRGGGPLSGVASFAPYAARGARLALAPVRFVAGRDGSTSITTIALIDGPFTGGRVRGLRLPVSGSFAANGGFAFGRTCIDARFAALEAGSLRLGPTRLPLCPLGRALVYRDPGASLVVGAAINRPLLAGRLGQSPLLIGAASARFVGPERFDASALAVRIGQPDRPMLLNAARFEGRIDKRGAGGGFTGASAIIGTVPLLLSEGAGKWRLDDGDVTLDAALTVSDRSSEPRFYPLRSDDVRFTLADRTIRAKGTLKHPATGARVTDVSITHRLDSGAGEALLDVPGIRFGEALQPEELTRFTEGVIALVQGTLRGQGRIAWSGSGEVNSSGEFSTDGMDLAAAFGPVTGMKGTIRFSDLLGLQTAPGQTIAVASINAGILAEDGVVTYQLLSDQRVRVQAGRWPFMGGELVLRETILNFGRPTPKRLTFEVVGLDANRLVDSFGFKEIKATGIFDGVLPMIFDESGGRIVGGRLDSRAPGGILSYVGVVSRANLGMFGGLAFDALRSLRFRSMIVRLDGDLAGEFATRLAIDQVALGDETKTARFIKSINRIPFKFNVTIKGPFRALIGTAKSFNDPRTLADQALPVPLESIPGVVTEVRRREEDSSQTQTTVDQKIDVTTKAVPTP